MKHFDFRCEALFSGFVLKTSAFVKMTRSIILSYMSIFFHVSRNDNNSVPSVTDSHLNVQTRAGEDTSVLFAESNGLCEGCQHGAPAPVRCYVRHQSLTSRNTFRQERRHLAQKSICAQFFFPSETAESPAIRRLAGQFPATAAYVSKCFQS